MAAATYQRLTLPAGIVGGVLQDGAAITLSITIPDSFDIGTKITTTPTGTPKQDQSGVPANAYGPQDSSDNTVSSSRQYFLSATNYSFGPVADTHPEGYVILVDQNPSNSTTPYAFLFRNSVNGQQQWLINTVSAAGRTGKDDWPTVNKNLGYTIPSTGRDVVFRPADSVWINREILYGRYYPAVSGQLDNVLISDKTKIASVATTDKLTLYVESKDGGRYVALRGQNMQYLQLVRDSTSGNMILRFSSSPSSLYTAQWLIFYSSFDQTVILQNRTANTCLALNGQNIGFAQTTYNYYGSLQQGNGAGSIFLQSYNFDTYVQTALYKTNTVPLATANTSAFAKFKCVIVPETTCDAANNPLSSVCYAAASSPQNTTSQNTLNSLAAYCAIGNNAAGPICSKLATTNSAAGSQYIPDYCSVYPNDIGVCGCIQQAPYYGLIEYLKLGGTSFLNACNNSNCASSTTAYRPTSYQNQKCVSNVCIAGINISNAVSVSITGVDINCSANDPDAPQSSGTTTAKGETPQSAANPDLGTIYFQPQTIAEGLSFLDKESLFILFIVILLLLGATILVFGSLQNAYVPGYALLYFGFLTVFQFSKKVSTNSI